NPLYGSDVLITDVISFNVRVLFSGYPDFIDLQDLSNLKDANNNSIFINVNRNSQFTLPQAVYDTWSQATDTLYDYSAWSDPTQTAKVAPSQPSVLTANGYVPSRILALQISIRVWDLKSQQARQITVVQDM